MQPVIIKTNTNFIGRDIEVARLRKIAAADEAAIITMYGRRRIGKTELLEQTFKNRNIIKFEGIEGQSEDQQRKNALRELAGYTGDLKLAKLQLDSWIEFFIIVYEYIKSGIWTLYLEELQWLANYNGTLIAELKYVWDNYYRHNNKLLVILCGSSPSFMIEKVVHSKALYNRSQYEFNLQELNLLDTKTLLSKRSDREVLEAYLLIGGMPEYLKWINKNSSVFLGLCGQAFTANGFFVSEYEKIFTSSLSQNKHYREIIEFLGKSKYASRTEIAKALKISSGGLLSSIILDLEKTGFIDRYIPYNAISTTRLVRYCIADNYLQFYFKFIKNLHKKIINGDFNNNPRSAIKTESLVKWLGFAFERWVRKHHRVIAKILGFSAVQYESGVFFSRTTDKENPEFQIDLIFDRSDNVYTICEIKYYQNPVSTKVINEFENKLELFDNKGNKTIHRVLICPEGIDQALQNRGYFDDVITRVELFNLNNWN